MATGGCPNPYRTKIHSLGRFNRFKVCAAANGWNDTKLVRLPILLKDSAWAIYDLLDEDNTHTYAHLKDAFL